MKTRIIICSLTISAAIWFGVNWFLNFMEIKDYGFTAANLIVMVCYVARGIMKDINKPDYDSGNKI